MRASAASARAQIASRNCASSSTFHTSVANIGITSDVSLHRRFWLSNGGPRGLVELRAR
jgi:hypothetical protein